MKGDPKTMEEHIDWIETPLSLIQRLGEQNYLQTKLSSRGFTDREWKTTAMGRRFRVRAVLSRGVGRRGGAISRCWCSTA